MCGLRRPKENRQEIREEYKACEAKLMSSKNDEDFQQEYIDYLSQKLDVLQNDCSLMDDELEELKAKAAAELDEELIEFEAELAEDEDYPQPFHNPYLNIYHPVLPRFIIATQSTQHHWQQGFEQNHNLHNNQIPVRGGFGGFY